MGYRDQASHEDSGLGYKVEYFLHILGNKTIMEYEIFPVILTPNRGTTLSLGEKPYHSWFQASTGIIWLRKGWTARLPNHLAEPLTHQSLPPSNIYFPFHITGKFNSTSESDLLML